MDIETQLIVRSNPNLYRFLREESYWYKYLNRSDANLKEFKTFIKKKYKLGTLDKIENGINTLDLVSNIVKNL